MVLLCHPLVNEERKRKKETILTSQATNERGALAEASGQSSCSVQLADLYHHYFP